MPQGSILGPLLFLIFINDFAFLFEDAFPIVFADDTNIVLSHSNFNTLIKNANLILNQSARWFKRNRLALNIDKTNYIIFKHLNKKYSSEEAKVFINDTEIQQVTQTKFLGVIVDEALSWKNHIALVSKKIMKSYGIIRRVSSFINRSCLLTLYYSLIYPYLSYCNLVWASTYPSSLHKLLLIQKKFVRLATSSSYLAPSDPLFKQLNILTIRDINIYQICVFMYNCIASNSPFSSVFHDFFIFNSTIHSYLTRQTNHLHCKFSRTSLGQFSIKTRGPIIWNSKPILITNCASVSILKSRLKYLLIHKPHCASNQWDVACETL